MKTLILFLLSAVLVFGQAANDQLITQRKPDNSGNIQRNVPMESAISTTLASYRSALGLGTEDDPQFNTVRINDSDGSHYLGIAAGSNLTQNRVLTFTTGDADRTFTLNGNPTLNDWFDQSVKTTASPSFASISATGFPVTGGYRQAVTLNNALLHTAFFNDSTGTSAYSLSRLAGNGDDSARSLVATVYGTSYSGGGLAIQDGARLESGSGLSGGLVISVAANAPMIFARASAEVARFNVSGQFETPVQIFTEGSAPSTPTSGRVAMYAKTDGRLYSMDDAGTETELGGGGGGAVDSVNGQTGVVTLDAEDVGAAGTADDNAFTGQNTFTLSPEVAWTAMTTGAGKTPSLNTQYYIAAFTANTTIDSYVGTPANGSRVAYNLKGCNGTATFTFPAAQRSGDPAGTSTSLTPTPGEHMIVFTYINGGWVYQDDVVLTGVAISGTFAAPITTDPLALPAYEAYNRVVFYGATGEIDLPVAVAGMNLIIYNTGAFTITIDPNGSDVIVRDGTAQSGGVSVTLSSGAGNYLAFVSPAAGVWVSLGYKGVLAQGS